MQNKPDNKTHCGGANPAETYFGKGQRAACGGNYSFKMKGTLNAGGQCRKQIVNRRHKGKAGDPAVNPPVIAEKSAGK